MEVINKSSKSSEKVNVVKIDPRLKSKMQELVHQKKLEDPESVDFLIEFIEECMTLEVVREKREKKAPKSPKETVKFGRVNAYIMFKKAKVGGDWKTMTDEQKAEYEMMAAEENAIRREEAIKWSDMSDEEKKAAEANKDIVVEKKAKKVDVVYDSYQAALRYLRKKYSDQKFQSWKNLGLDAKEQWNEFATSKLSEGMNKDLKRDLIVAAADAAYEQMKA